jgi:hypothetical protein
MMTDTKTRSNGCGCSTGSNAVQPARTEKKKVTIDFLYLDLESCEPCQGSEESLEDALTQISTRLETTRAEVELNKIHVTSYDQALQLGFVSSPTIRVNGQDLALEVRESHCSSCSSISGTETFCRVWDFEGREYKAAPKALIVEAVLRVVFAGDRQPDRIAGDPGRVANSLANLKSFFEGTRVAATSCGDGICGT